MHELVYDVIIGLIFISIIYVVINLFDSNIGLINSSTSDKTVQVKQLDTSDIRSSLYTGADVLGYIRVERDKELKDIADNIAANKPEEPNEPDDVIIIGDEISTAIIDNENRLTKLNNAIVDLKLNMNYNYKHYKESNSFIKN